MQRITRGSLNSKSWKSDNKKGWEDGYTHGYGWVSE